MSLLQQGDIDAMDRKTRKACFAATLLVAPTLAGAAETAGRAQGAPAARPSLEASRLDLAPALPAPIRDAADAKQPLRSATGAHFASARQTIDGPAVTYRTSRRGPVFEAAALGGGAMANVPFLAHLGMDWRF